MFIRGSCLTDMCLNVIVNNLELIVINERIPKKCVDFLLRCYSGKVFHEYRKLKKSITDDVMLWFLNRHVKEVTLPKKSFSGRIINKLQSIGMGITSLNLHRSAAPRDVLNAIIRCVPNVEHLDLSHTCCTANTLSVIQEVCRNLESLNLSCCSEISDECLEKLCGENKSLKILDLTDSGVECYGALIVLNRMPLLECLKFDGFADMMTEGEDFGHQKYYLTEFVYDNMNHLKDIRTLTKICPNIRKLHLKYPVGKKALQACTGFKNLEELKFKVSHRTNYDIRMDNFLSPILPLSANLKTLILSCLQIPTVMLVENFSNLEKLYLKKVSFTSFKEEDIKCTENRLKTLVIKDTEMEDSGKTYQAITLLISLSKNVTNLDLSHNRELPSGLYDVILNSMKSLSSVSFYYTHVTMALLLPFFDIPSLKMIIANCYDDDNENFSTRKLMPKFSSTLSWCRMFNEDSDDDIPPNDDIPPADDDSDSTDHDSMNDNAISDNCDSDRSTPDRYYYFPDDCGYNPYGGSYFEGDLDSDEYD